MIIVGASGYVGNTYISTIAQMLITLLSMSTRKDILVAIEADLRMPTKVKLKTVKGWRPIIPVDQPMQDHFNLSQRFLTR